MMKYLLPCDRCGEKTAIDPGQAGQQVVCQCGAEMEVPSFRAVRELEQFDAPEPTRAPRSWNASRGIPFALGLVLAAIGLTAAIFCGINWTLIDTSEPPVEDLEPVLSRIDDVGASTTWDIWVDMRDKGIGPYFVPEHVMARQAASNLRWLMTISLIVAAVGVAVCIGALRIKKKRPG